MKAWAVMGALVFGAPFPAVAAPLVPDFFVRSGPSETVVAPFSEASGVSTLNQYSGFVEIISSGVGNSQGLNLNDTFYLLDPLEVPTGVYEMDLGTNEVSFSGLDPNTIVLYMEFVEDIGFVAAPFRPPYSTDNVYHFVIAVPDSTPTPLTFGVSDGLYHDNGGQFVVEVFQLQTIPEPRAAILLALGLLGLGARRYPHGSVANQKRHLRYWLARPWRSSLRFCMFRTWSSGPSRA